MVRGALRTDIIIDVKVVFKRILYKIGTMTQIAWQGVHKFKVWVGANPIWTSVQIQYFSRVGGGRVDVSG